MTSQKGQTLPVVVRFSGAISSAFVTSSYHQRGHGHMDDRTMNKRREAREPRSRGQPCVAALKLQTFVRVFCHETDAPPCASSAGANTEVLVGRTCAALHGCGLIELTSFATCERATYVPCRLHCTYTANRCDMTSAYEFTVTTFIDER